MNPGSRWRGGLAVSLAAWISTGAAPVLEPGLFYFSPVNELSVYGGVTGLLRGTNGCQFVESSADSALGYGAAIAGDVNGDGLADVVLGAPRSTVAGKFLAGQAFVIHGSGGWQPSENVNFLAGSNGFTVGGADFDEQLGSAVSGAGDFNNDGFDDVLIGVPGADPSGRVDAGAAVILFGGTNAQAAVDSAALDGTNGMRLDGAARSNRCGTAVAPAGDFNGDGLADVLIGAENASTDGLTQSGKVFVVFGTTNRVASLDLGALNGTNGVVFEGESAFDFAGRSVAGLGDFNGDQRDDIIVGASRAPDVLAAGRAYVVFGASNWPASVSLSSLDGTNGFRVNGASFLGYAGSAVAGADVNGDGLSDAVVGAPQAGSGGTVYVLFGNTNRVGVIAVGALNGTNGFAIQSQVAGANLGASVAGRARLNGDGIEDLVCGAPAWGGGTGEVVVVFGRSSFPAVLQAEQLDGTNGFVLRGLQAGAEAGWSVGAGRDANGDGFDDIAIGERFHDHEGVTDTGAAYLVSPVGISEFVLLRPEFITIRRLESGARLLWQGQSGATYAVQTNGSLTAGGWGEAASTVAASETTVLDVPDGSATGVFFRLRAAR